MNRTVNIVGVAITTVHNPAFTPFASYDAGFNGGLTPSSQLPPGLRYQQTRTAQYKCVPAAQMTQNNLSFECLDVRISWYCNYQKVERLRASVWLISCCACSRFLRMGCEHLHFSMIFKLLLMIKPLNNFKLPAEGLRSCLFHTTLLCSGLRKKS